MPGQSQMLTDITRGMHHAASTTAAMVAQQYIRIIDQFFDEESDGTISAKMVKVNMDEDHFMMVPLIALVAPKGLALDKMVVHMAVKIDKATIKEATDKVDNSKATRSSFSVSLSPKASSDDADLTRIEMVFTSGDPPEGINRIIEEYSNQIRPIPIKSANGNHKKFCVIGKESNSGNGSKIEHGPENKQDSENDS